MNSIYTEYANLTPYNIKWLDECGAFWANGGIFSSHVTRMSCVGFEKTFFGCISHNENYTHLTTGDEFCQRVAEILGIDKPTFGDDPWVSNPLNKIYPLSTVTGSKMTDEQHDKLFPGRQNMGEASLTQEDIHTLLGDKVEKAYPYKTYRVLESLDGIPLDTRIPLSEWIPPRKSEVIFIDEHFYQGTLEGIFEDSISIKPRGETMFLRINLDGHWMRIV